MIDKSTRILIIDDDSFLRATYRKYFEQAGCTMYELPDANGNLAVKVLRYQPTLIVTDIIMPGRNGLDAIKILKTDGGTKSIPMFVASNQSDVTILRKAIEYGAIDHLCLSKFKPHELVDKVLEYIKNPKTYVPVAQRQARWEVEDVLSMFQNQISKLK